MDQAIDHRSPSEQLATCPIEEQEAFIKSLSEDEAEALLYDWRGFNARPDQIAPEGYWEIWLLLAGRGFGKTRSGAEWIKEQVEGGARRIALVAETQKDLEEVMVAGESGILSLYPENMQPKYTKKPVKIVWPNGAIALGYNATEPDQLRGPQFDCAWCFIAGTMITCNGNEVPVEQLNVGDKVLTRKGLKEIEYTSQRAVKVGTVKFSNGTELTGSADHPVLTSHGWTNLSELNKGDRICVVNALNGVESVGIGTTADTLNIGARAQRAIGTGIDYTGLSIRNTLEASLKAMTFITRMVIRPTMPLKTSNVLQGPITCENTEQHTQYGPAIGPTNPSLMLNVMTAVRSLKERWLENLSVRSANKLKQTINEPQKEIVSIAAKNLKVSMENIAFSVASTWVPDGVQTVYNLQVKGQPEYFANGILTHNCDELAKWRHARATWDQLQFGLRLGDHPQQIVTTTPRPIEILKEIVAGKEGKIVTTRGSTKDNLANLAPSFIRKIYNRYKDTRLGRQELNAEILGDIPNALWTYQTLETSRVLEAPDLGRIVISIDPAVSNTENSDAHGIFAIGLDEDGNDAYVLEDGSLHGSPLDWATRVLLLYDKYQADAIVAEINQGGDMVEHTIKTKRSNANVIKVRATKGKHVRAEPVASLYEQGRVHHVGAFDELEKEMTMMTTSGYKGDNSPDRLDSVVWGITELLPDLILEKTEPIKMNFTGWNG